MKSIGKIAAGGKRRRAAFFAACLASALFFYVGGITAFADAEGTVIPSSATVRSSADTSSDAVGSAKQNDKVTITGKTTGADGQTWYQVVAGGGKGFIRADLVKVGSDGETAAGLTITQTSADVSPADISSGTVNSASVNIRKGPSTTDAVAGSAKQGAELSVTGQTTGADGKVWYQVSNGSVTGFVRKDLLEPSAGENTPEGGDAAEGGEEMPSDEGEGTPDPGTPDASQEPEAGDGADSYTKLNNVVSSRVLPEGTDLSGMQIDQAKLAEWESGQYYVLYTNSSDGTDQWYLYDTSQGSCMKITNPTVTDSDKEGSDAFGKNTKIILIVMAVVILVLVITVTVLLLKLRDAGLDDDEDEEEEEDEDDEDDEDEDDAGARAGRVNSRAWRPRNFLHASDEDEEDEEDEDEEEDDEEDEDDDEPARPVRRKNPQTVKRPAAKPQAKRQEPLKRQPERSESRRDKEEGRTAAKAKKPAPKPAYYEDDEDDEFEFEFLNMDGKDDFS